jgi:hypothetical protein
VVKAVLFDDSLTILSMGERNFYKTLFETGPKVKLAIRPIECIGNGTLFANFRSS